MHKSLGHNVDEIVSPTFTEDTANKIGLSQRTIQHEVQIAEKIDSQVKERIRNTELADNKKELLLLARLEENILIEAKVEASVETKPRNKIETVWKKQIKRRNNYLNASLFSKLPMIYWFDYLEKKHLLCFLKCFFLQCYFKNQYKEETNYETKLRKIQKKQKRYKSDLRSKERNNSRNKYKT